MAGRSLSDALKDIGHPEGAHTRSPILRTNKGTLITFGRFTDGKTVVWVGVRIGPTSSELVGEPPRSTGHGAMLGLSGPAASLVDLFLDAARTYLERVEQLDTEIAEVQSKGPDVPLASVWHLREHSARLRAHVDRALVAAAELGGPHSNAFPGFAQALPSVEAELTRVQQLSSAVQQSLSDLILLRNAEESNRISRITNELAKTSNRIAALQNTSNIRMLGLTYLALFLALVTAVVLFPNTGATILGMPSANWVPGIWVDFTLIALTVLPLVLVFTRPWVRRVFRDLASSEVVAAEGVSDLPELTESGRPLSQEERLPTKRPNSEVPHHPQQGS